MIVGKSIKVIFLDIDGCLSNSKYGEDLYFDKYANSKLAIDPANLANFKSVIDNVPDAKIVWSTDWRFYDKKFWHNKWLNPRLYLESLPWISRRIFGKTPKRMSSEHFHEIKWWLDEHSGISRYAIIEDSYFPDDWFGLEQHLVKCNHEYGLTAENASLVIRLLNGDENAQD